MSSTDEIKDSYPIHLLIFPFPAAGHIIPLLDLTRHILTRHLNDIIITFVIDPSSLSLLQPLLNNFPSFHIQPLILSPPSLPASTSHFSRIRATHALHDPIVSWFRSHPSPPTVLLCDFFLPWTHSLSSTLSLPRVVFYPSGAFASSVMYSMWRDAPTNPENDSSFQVGFDEIPNSPRFKWSELSYMFRAGKLGDPEWNTYRNELLNNLMSSAAVFNSFSELESLYIGHFKKEMGHDRVWAVGPLLPECSDDMAIRGGLSSVPPGEMLTWLDGKPEGSVVYVCFGSRTSLTVEELKVLGAALEYSGVHFIWCIRESNDEEMIMPDSDYENRVAGRGFVVKGWVPQVAILRHVAVGAFLTHCGWNSVMESISAGVMMLAWPMGADQYSNAKLVVNQLGLGSRVVCYGPDDIPEEQELNQLLVASVSQTRPQKDRVMRLREAAAAAVVNGGSSTVDLKEFVNVLRELK